MTAHWRCPDCEEACAGSMPCRGLHRRCGAAKRRRGAWSHVAEIPTASEERLMLTREEIRATYAATDLRYARRDTMVGE